MSYDLIRRLFAFAAVLIAWAVLGLNVHPVLAPHPADAAAILQAALHLFASFAGLTALFAALALTIAIAGRATIPWANVMTALAVALVVVAGVHQGAPAALPAALLPRLGGIGLYCAVPGLFVIYWLLFVPKGRAWAIAPLLWLVYPLAWMGAGLVRGLQTGGWPCPFLDLAHLGPHLAAIHAAELLTVFLAAGICFYALDRLFRPLDAP